MKKAVLVTLILVVLLFCLPSCGSAISQEEYDALQSNLDNAEDKIDKLTEDLAALQANYESGRANYENLQADYEKLTQNLAALQSNYETLQADHKTLQVDYESLPERLKESTLKNPTWSELERFLERNDTDTQPYIEDGFDCSGFAITLRDNAWRFGIRCAYVEVHFSEAEGHALNAFETTDKGLIYVDNTGGDQIAYVKINQPYGTIHLDGAKFDYIACTGSPTEFWGSLTYSTHSSPFSYNYYIDYQRRSKFYNESVDGYNKAVDEYKKGSTKWSYSQLATWFDNLDALEQDLGSVFYEPLEVVKSIEAYWN